MIICSYPPAAYGLLTSTNTFSSAAHLALLPYPYRIRKAGAARDRAREGDAQEQES